VLAVFVPNRRTRYSPAGSPPTCATRDQSFRPSPQTASVLHSSILANPKRCGVRCRAEIDAVDDEEPPPRSLETSLCCLDVSTIFEEAASPTPPLFPLGAPQLFRDRTNSWTTTYRVRGPASPPISATPFNPHYISYVRVLTHALLHYGNVARLQDEAKRTSGHHPELSIRSNLLPSRRGSER